MSQLIVDFITSLDGYASADGWPGWWGLESPGYLAWLDERPERDIGTSIQRHLATRIAAS